MRSSVSRPVMLLRGEQVYGVDFFETWAPVGRYATLGALLSICVIWDLETKRIDIKCVTRRKQHRPGSAPNANTTHVPTAGCSAAPTKPNHIPSRHSRAKGKLLLQTVTPHAAGSRRTHVSRTQEFARTRPVTRRATTQYLHTGLVLVL